MNEERFFSIACKDCHGLAFQQDEEGGESIPVYHSKHLAQMEIDSMEDEHPLAVCEISVKILL